MSWFRHASLTAKTAVAVSLPVTLLLGLILYTGYQQRLFNASESDVRRALAIQADIQLMRGQIAELSNAAQGYLLTGQAERLAQQRAGEAQLPITLAALAARIQNVTMRDYLRELNTLSEDYVELVQALTVSGHSADAPLDTGLDAAYAQLLALQRHLDTMDKVEQRLLENYLALANQSLSRLFYINSLTAILVVAFALLMLLFLFRSVLARIRLLVSYAEDLVEGKEIPRKLSSYDELGQLSSRLHNASLLLADRAAAAEVANQAKSRFLSRVSHELKTPLHAIMGFTRVLRSFVAQAPREAQAALGEIEHASEHLAKLIEDTLDVSRAESSDWQLAIAPVSLEQVVDESVRLMASLAHAKRIHIECPALDTPVTVMADYQRSKQVLLNLLSNAIKFSPEGSVVTLSLQCDGQQAELSVQDRGCGISPSAVAQLFQPFERLHADAQGVSGTGLGLALSRQLMARMQGAIRFSDTPGGGSTFTITFALAEAQASAQSPSTFCLHAPMVTDDEAVLLQAVLQRRRDWRLCREPSCCAQPNYRLPDSSVANLPVPELLTRLDEAARHAR